ncbi:MAG TPA: PstS family phosphate ABC transporter substrate-binding protein, partial [Herpetosiphonaceae bacterium]|nr:PstS family phosphate ABC transporter substrate-binding protein [Herpetosiphonaceae bacterium]
MAKVLRTLIIGLMLAVMLAACGGSTSGSTATTGAATGATAEQTQAATAETTAPAATTEETAMAGETAMAMGDETATAGGTETETATAAAGAASGAAAEVTLPEVNPLEVSGDIITAGSSTVFPLSTRMAERFTDEGYAGNITIDSIGSGGGIERFCVAADIDIANSSRAIEEEEKTQCAGKGREVLEFRVGTDALAVVVSTENDFVDDLSKEQLADIYSGTAKTWQDVDPGFPAENIQLFSPGTDSGTFDYFVEAILDEDESKILGANPQLSENDNVLVQGVQGSPYAIGYFGYAYYNENKDTLKALMIDGVEPTEETAEDNSYPLSRPLFIYSAASIMDEKPQVAAFINFYLSNVNDEVIDVGYFP